MAIEQRFQVLSGKTSVTVECENGVFRLALHEGEKLVRASLTRAQMRALSDNLKHMAKVKT